MCIDNALYLWYCIAVGQVDSTKGRKTMSSFRMKLEAGQKLCGTHVSLTDPSVCEILGYQGFDYLWIDMEHTYIDYKTLLIHLNAARAAGTSAVVRIPENDLVTLKKVLEMGPDGIIFPMVKTYEQAQALINASLYPPRGNRGFGPKRAIRYGIDDVEDYIRKGSKDTCRFIQIEHVDTLSCLDKILTIDEIDGYIIGPCDLSGSIGELPDVFGANTMRLIEQIVSRVKAAGKPVGVSYGAYDEQTVRVWHDLGMDFISLGGDAEYIQKGAKAALDALKAFHGDAPEVG